MRVFHDIYGIYISVAPKQKDLSLTGIPDEYVQIGTELDLTCAISRTKPGIAEIYWTIGGIRYNGSDVQTIANNDGTFSQSKALMYRLAILSLLILYVLMFSILKVNILIYS